jgi:hypothetical protein
LKYTTLEGNRHVRGFTFAVFDCDHQVTFRTSYLGPVAMEYFIRAFVEQTENLILSSLNHDDLKKSKVLKKSATEIVSILFLNTFRMICSSKLLSFPLIDLVERVFEKEY